MKLYTKEEIKRTFGFGMNKMKFDGFMNAMKPIELPTWDDVRKAIELAQTVKDYGNYKPYTEEEIIEQLKQSKL